jgi:hypothetical protein
MDLLDTLRKKISSIAAGDHVAGLNAVLLHIETAFRHLSRGQDNADETAFTDAIYRTNQAFEGSIKEAFRVLTEQDPAHKRPYDIEGHLEKEGIFKPRVLSQFTTYRKDWRNPSTHDYKLYFDESEAFLAIISVTAFACLLLDQISEQLAFRSAKAEAESKKAVLAASLDAEIEISKRTSNAILEFCQHHMPINNALATTESQIVGSLHGFLSSVAPDLTIETDVLLDQRSRYRADMKVSGTGASVLIEVKRVYRKDDENQAIDQVMKYMSLAQVNNSILLFLPGTQSEMEIQDIFSASMGEHISIIKPKKINRRLEGR